MGAGEIYIINGCFTSSKPKKIEDCLILYYVIVKDDTANKIWKFATGERS